METALDDIDFIQDDIEAIKKSKVAHKRQTATKKIRVRSGIEVALDNYRASRKLHRQAIKGLRRSIKTHKLMIKQARNNYRLVKLSK